LNRSEGLPELRCSERRQRAVSAQGSAPGSLGTEPVMKEDCTGPGFVHGAGPVSPARGNFPLATEGAEGQARRLLPHPAPAALADLSTIFCPPRCLVSAGPPGSGMIAIVPFLPFLFFSAV